MASHLVLDPKKRLPLLRAPPEGHHAHKHLPEGKVVTHPSTATNDENAQIYFIGNATTVIEWRGIRILTDPNFLHAGDHVHLGPGITAQRRTNPAVDLEDMPPIDVILLSHYHEDHFDKLVENSLNRNFPIISTPHAKKNLSSDEIKDEPFHAVTALDFFESIFFDIHSGDPGSHGQPVIKVTAMPGKHKPEGIAYEDLPIPPTNGWLLEFGYLPDASETGTGTGTVTVKTGYRVYISGDTLFVDELKEIPKRLKDDKIDLMLVHLGGTTVPGPTGMVMVTMDAKQGLQLVQLIKPKLTLPIHYDDYDAFLSPLSDFKAEMQKAGLDNQVVYLDRGELYRFTVKEP
ncbi:hypothetical protein PT974_01195 [Cladobotryum mycophilum]|uniref:Metallo-beta-lactamase domain-containing protein n=1 Tax=Cladobotryum mycophilum TaxID=491253 RepID=A0ABR0T391_9HYPO